MISYIIKTFLTVLLLSSVFLAQNYEIKFDINNGGAWFGGDNTITGPRNVAQAQSVFIEQPITIESFGVYFYSKFDSALNGTNSGHEVSLRLFLRDSLGTILVNRLKVLPDTFSGGWVNWSNINYDVNEPSTYIFSCFLVGGYDSNQVRSVIAFDIDGGYSGGIRYSKNVVSNEDARLWVNWVEYSSDLNFWLKGTLLPTKVENEKAIPTEFVLEQNYPNPFNPTTKIIWQSPVGSHQTLKVFDVLGNEVATLVDEYKSAGTYEVEFEGNNLPSGVYFYSLTVGSFTETKKLVLIQ